MADSQDILDNGSESSVELSKEQANQYAQQLKRYRWQVRAGRVGLGLFALLMLLQISSMYLTIDDTLLPEYYNWELLRAMMPQVILSFVCFILCFWYPRIPFALVLAYLIYQTALAVSSYTPPNWLLMYAVMILMLTLVLIGTWRAFKRHPILKKLKSLNLKDF